MSDGISRDTSWGSKNNWLKDGLYSNVEEPESNKSSTGLTIYPVAIDLDKFNESVEMFFHLEGLMRNGDIETKISALDHIIENMDDMEDDDIRELLCAVDVKDPRVISRVNEIEQLLDYDEVKAATDYSEHPGILFEAENEFMSQLKDKMASLTLEEKSCELYGEHPSIIFAEALNDMFEVIKQGAKKHGAGSWKDKDNFSLQHDNNSNSMFHHLAEHYNGVNVDADSGVDPLLHLACRAMMQYVRKKKG